MNPVEVDIAATSDDVFAVLADPFAYRQWVVGTQRIRGADPGWPAKGSRFYHRVGVGPVHVRDVTQVIDVDAPHRLVLEVFFRPGGVGVVELTMSATEGGTRVVMQEVPTRGPARAGAAVTTRLVRLRNRASLRRLKRLVEQRAGAPGS